MAELSDEHKQAMQEGREQARAIREYLDALNWSAPRPGLPSDPESVAEMVEDYDQRIAETDDPLDQVKLVQRKLDLEEYLEELQDRPDPEATKDAFVKSVVPYSERNDLTYKAWRAIGVPASVLHEAGMK